MCALALLVASGQAAAADLAGTITDGDTGVAIGFAQLQLLGNLLVLAIECVRQIRGQNTTRAQIGADCGQLLGHARLSLLLALTIDLLLPLELFFLGQRVCPHGIFVDGLG